MNEALRDWVANVEHSYYCLGSVMGPHPYPWMVREFHRVVGDEAREQCRALPGATPTSWWRASVAAPTPSGCSPASSTPPLALVGVESAGGAAIGHGTSGHVHGMHCFLLQDYGQVEEAQSISAGLDYPGVGPEHAYLA